MATDERHSDSVVTDDASNSDGKPPIFRTWRGMYAFVIGTLAVLVILLSIISWRYR